MKYLTLFIIVGIIELFGSTQATNYCNSVLCRGLPHIGCNNSGNLSSACPKNTQLVSMTAALKYSIVKRHNINRNNLAAGKLTNFLEANQMATMSWNDELAYLAELNVKRCDFGYDLCRNTDSFRFSGQNIAISQWTTEPPTDESTILAQIDSWWANYNYSSMEYIRKFPNDKIISRIFAQFMLMASDRNIAVGCGAIKYTESYWNKFLLTCNYARTNMISATTYVTGPATSNCTTGRNLNYPALCSLNEPIDPNSYILV